MSLRQSSTVMRAMMNLDPGNWGKRSAKLVDEIAMPRKLSGQPQALRPYDADQVAHCDVKILIDNNIVELGHMGDLLASRAKPPLDHLLAVLSPRHQAFA